MNAGLPPLMAQIQVVTFVQTVHHYRAAVQSTCPLYYDAASLGDPNDLQKPIDRLKAQMQASMQLGRPDLEHTGSIYNVRGRHLTALKVDVDAVCRLVRGGEQVRPVQENPLLANEEENWAATLAHFLWLNDDVRTEKPDILPRSITEALLTEQNLLEYGRVAALGDSIGLVPLQELISRLFEEAGSILSESLQVASEKLTEEDIASLAPVFGTIRAAHHLAIGLTANQMQELPEEWNPLLERNMAYLADPREALAFAIDILNPNDNHAYAAFLPAAEKLLGVLRMASNHPDINAILGNFAGYNEVGLKAVVNTTLAEQRKIPSTVKMEDGDGGPHSIKPQCIIHLPPDQRPLERSYRLLARQQITRFDQVLERMVRESHEQAR